MTDSYVPNLVCLKFSFLVLAPSNLEQTKEFSGILVRAPCCPGFLTRVCPYQGEYPGGDGERASQEAPAEGARGPAKRSAAKPGELLRGGPAMLL